LTNWQGHPTAPPAAFCCFFNTKAGNVLLSFKISPGAHDKVRRISSIICSVFAVGFVLVMYLTEIGNRLRTRRILADHRVASAPLALDEVTEERGRRGRTKEMCHFTYSLQVTGQP